MLVAILLLPGCWLHPGFGPERQNSNPFEHSLTEANVGSLHQAWSVPTEGAGGEPLVAGGAVFLYEQRGFGTSDERLTVRALSRRSGATLWQRDLPDDQSLGGGGILSVAGDEVLTVRPTRTTPSETRFETLDVATGATVATAVTSNRLAPDTAAVGSGVIANREITSSSPSQWNLVVRSRDTFEVLWSAPIGSFSLPSHDPVIIGQGHIYLRDDGEGPPVVRAYPVGGCGAATCTPTSTFAVPVPQSQQLDWVDAQLLTVTDDGHLLLRRSWSEFHAIIRDDLMALTSDGEVAWTVPFRQMTGVAVAGDTVVAVGDDDGVLPGGIVVGRSSSSTWRAGGVVFEGAVAIAGGLAYVANDQVVHVFNAAGCGSPTCDELTSVGLGSGTGGIQGMSVAGGMLFVNKAGPGGGLLAFAPTGSS